MCVCVCGVCGSVCSVSEWVSEWVCGVAGGVCACVVSVRVCACE